MRVICWQWGRRGGGPRFAMGLRQGFEEIPGATGLLSLSEQAEVLHAPGAPVNDLPFRTYEGGASLIGRLLEAPFGVGPLSRRVGALAPGLAVCAMPALLDPLMTASLARLGIPYAVVAHDAVVHPGDHLSAPIVGVLQRRLLGGARAVIALSAHVAAELAAQDIATHAVAAHPPFLFGPRPPAPFSHGGAVRLLFFGRLLAYKGLDLLAEVLAQPDLGCEVRVVGSGPETPALAALRGLPGVRVENRWVPEAEVGDLLAWADAVILPYREASQSGVAPAALAAGRRVIATEVGGLAEQVRGCELALLCPPDARALAAAIRALPALAGDGAAAPESGWRQLAETILAASSR